MSEQNKAVIRQLIDEVWNQRAFDKVVVCWSSIGTHRGEMQGIAPTNRKVVANGIAIYRFGGGKVVEEWMNTDQLGILKQLGVIP